MSAEPREWMVERQLRRRGIADEAVLAAMERVPRELFVPAELRDEAYADEALPIGDGQTISQPYMVALICELLALRGAERVLDVGTGSGYQAAVLAELAAEVHSIERHPELAEVARANLAVAGYADRVELHVGDGSRGLPERAPFDAIAVAAAAAEPPPALYEQLELGGRLVVPVGDPVGGRAGQWLEVVTKTAGGPAARRTVPCRFVPLVAGIVGRMGSDSAAELLQLPVTLDGIRLGRCVDVVLDEDGEQVVGVVVLCGDDSERFLVLDAAEVRDGEIAVTSALHLLEGVDFYRRRGRSIRG